MYMLMHILDYILKYLFIGIVYVFMWFCKDLEEVQNKKKDIKTNMIIEIQPCCVKPCSKVLSVPPMWLIYYKEENELHFNMIRLPYHKLKLFLEQYGYETNNISALINYGFSVKNIKHRYKL